MDLRRDFPRSLREKLGGYVHLARMIDKVRAVIAGTEGEYIYPCPMDDRLLQFAGLSAEAFRDAVRGRPDEAILEWFSTTALWHSDRDREEWNRTMLTLQPDTPEKREYFKNTRDGLDPTRTDITTWADLLDLEEKRDVPVRPHQPAR
jgi:hypothetical protein